MTPKIVYSNSPITLIGGGETRSEDLKLALDWAPTMVAADGGADMALLQGCLPDHVIGDMDSITTEARLRISPERMHLISEQDSTDFDKALRSVSAPLVVGVGFLGGRLDHQLAVLNSLVRVNDPPCILIGAHEIVFHVPSDLTLDLAPGDVVSLFPMRSVLARSTGLMWSLDGLTLTPDGRVGTSNRATGPVRIMPQTAGLLIMVPKSALEQVVRALKLRSR